MAEILSYNPYRDMHGNVQFSAAFSGKNIQQIAYELNFSNQSSFGKYFKPFWL